jgi:hypothetical protein
MQFIINSGLALAKIGFKKLVDYGLDNWWW